MVSWVPQTVERSAWAPEEGSLPSLVISEGLSLELTSGFGGINKTVQAQGAKALLAGKQPQQTMCMYWQYSHGVVMIEVGLGCSQC